MCEDVDNIDDVGYFSANESSENESFASLLDTLDDQLRDSFHNQSPQSLLNVCHVNAQSVPSHVSELTDTFSGYNVHAILISKTWLKLQLPSTFYPLIGFVLVRNDRLESRRVGGSHLRP